MKTLSAEALTEIAKKLGTEPTTIIGIDWYRNGNFFLYGDRLITDVIDDSRILSISPITTTISNRIGQATDVTLILDDTDNHIRSILEETNPYHCDCIIYQYFRGIAATSKFVLFKGVLNTPMNWSETDRSVEFEVISEIEDTEIGVSLEETDIVEVDPDVNTPPWPLAFGNVVYVPATKVTQYPEAKLTETFCVIDPMIYAQMETLTAAWYDQQAILIFWKLVLQGADILCPGPSQLIVSYTYWIKLEAYYTTLVESNKDEIAAGTLLRHNPKKKNPADAALIDQIDDLRDENRDYKDILRAIKQQKELIETYINLAQYEKELKRAAAANIVGAYNGLLQIYYTYVEAMNAVCRRSYCAKLNYKVDESDRFEQDTPLTLIINNLKWRGYFNAGYLYISPVAMARYTQIPLAVRQSVTDECGNIEDMRGADVFWVDDESYNLTNMYLLVRDIRGNARHIIKVIEQEGTKCRFQLIPYGSYNFQGKYGANVVRSVVSIPRFDYTGWGTIPDSWQGIDPSDYYNAWATLSATTLTLLAGTVPNEEELRNLRTLENLLPWENVGSDVIVVVPSPRDVFTITAWDIVEIEEASPVPLPGWFNWPILLEEYPSALEWEAPIGTPIREEGYEHDIYVANILPSTVKAVHAYRTVDDVRTLTQVPTGYYSKNEAEALKDIDGNTKLTITSIRVKVPLSTIQGESWEDQIYVTMDSSVGPNTVDILEYFIDTYTDKSKDSTSFSAVETAIDDYSSSFALLTRPNVYEVMNDIAMQARCALYLNNDTFYIKYLAKEPTSDATLTEADINVENSLEVEHGDAGNLITKIIATWRPDYSEDSERFLTFRHNVNQYGVKEKEMDFFIYNVERLVVKSATFWLIRWANLWKQVTFSTFLPQLQLDLYDTVTFDLEQAFLADVDIKGVIESIQYSGNENKIIFSCWLPIKVGEMDEYLFAWPANTAYNEEFPTDLEIEEGRAGGSGIGKGIVTVIQGQ